MNDGKLAAQSASPFDGLSDARHLYSGAPHREALETLRYGVEARKGFILCFGAPGTGKSTLLQKLAGELHPSVTFLLLRDPHLSFTDIIRWILRGLKEEAGSANEVELLRECQTTLRTRHEAGRNIALAFDDAHHMRDKVIEQVLQNFTGAGPGDSPAHLAQVILAGRQELKERFLRPSLRSVTAPVALECELRALTDKEASQYVAYRLGSADLPLDLFDDAALQSIARFSGGNLRLVNALCDRAFQAADRSVSKQIGADRVDSAAKDLDLWQPGWVHKEKKETTFAIPRGSDEAFQFQYTGGDTTETIGQTFLHLSGAHDSKRWLGTRRRGGRFFMGVVLAAVFLAAPGVWLYEELGKSSLREWGVLLSEIARVNLQPPAPSKTGPTIESEEIKQADAAPSTPAAENPPLIIDDHEISAMPPIKMENPAPRPTPAPAKNPEPDEPKLPPRTVARAKQPPQERPNKPRNDPAWQISQAIENRAITGVRVTVKDDIAYLDGQVATERQRRAAENAARDAADVRGVRNRIVIE